MVENVPPAEPIESEVTIGLASTVLVATNPRRVGLIISAPSTNRFSVRFRGPAVLDQGVTLYPGQQPLSLVQGAAALSVTGEITAISAVAPQVVHVTEFVRL